MEKFAWIIFSVLSTSGSMIADHPELYPGGHYRGGTPPLEDDYSESNPDHQDQKYKQHYYHEGYYYKDGRPSNYNRNYSESERRAQGQNVNPRGI